MKRFAWLVVPFTLLLLQGVVRGDEVILKNGEKIKGKVLSAADGKLTVKSENMGEVSVSIEDMVTFSTEEALKVVFKNGTAFDQPVSAGEDGKVRIKAEPSGQEITLPISEIDKINPPKAKWTGNVNAGAAFARGNTYYNTANVSAEAVRRGERDRMRFEAGYQGNRQEDVDTGDTSTTQRYVYGGLQYDYFFTKKVYGLAKLWAERDAVANIDLRYMASMGAGWQVVERDDLAFSAEAGLSWVSENYIDETEDSDDNSYMSGRLAYKFFKELNKSVKFIHNLDFYPGFEVQGGYLVITDAALRSTLVGSLFAEAKVEFTWDSTPSAGYKRQDVMYLLSLGWSF